MRTAAGSRRLRLRPGTVALLLTALLGLAGAPATATPWAGAAKGHDRADGQPTPVTPDRRTASPATRRWRRDRRLVAVLRTVGPPRRRRTPQAPGATGRWAAAAMRGPPALAR